MVRTASTGIRFLVAAGVALTLAAGGCKSDDPPGGGGNGGNGSSRGQIGEDPYGAPPSRDAEGIAAARRMGLRTVYFDYDQSALRSDAQADLKHNFDVLRQRPDVRVEIQGHCDERGSNEYNFALGERRATATRDYLVRLGIPDSRIEVVSFGEESPAAPGSGESVWAKNRRAEFSVLR